MILVLFAALCHEALEHGFRHGIDVRAFGHGVGRPEASARSNGVPSCTLRCCTGGGLRTACSISRAVGDFMNYGENKQQLVVEFRIFQDVCQGDGTSPSNRLPRLLPAGR